MKSMLAAIVFAVSATVLIDGGANPAAAQESNDLGLTRSQVEDIVREHLLENPEILIDMQTRLEEKQREEQRVAAEEAIASSADQIFHNPNDAVIGNPDGDVTIVEFFDYNCGYCRRALSDMEALVDRDDNLRFVLKEFPILGPESQEAHRVSMAFHSLAPQQYEEYHRRLLGSDGRADENTAIAIARELGIDEDSLREAMQNPEIASAIKNTYELANQLQITGTPSYVIGGEVVSGAIGEEQLSQKIENARQ